MKKNIHPRLNQLDIHCRCGNTFKITSTMHSQGSLNLERCGTCLTANIGTYRSKQEGASAREKLFKDFSISDLVD